MNVEGQIQRKAKTPHRLDGVRTDPIACGIAWDFIENRHRTGALPQQLGETAYVQFQIGPFYILHFRDGVRRFDKIV
jgi:hypothetical protein